MIGTNIKKLVMIITIAVVGASVLGGCQEKKSATKTDDVKTETVQETAGTTEQNSENGLTIWDIPSCDDEEHLKEINAFVNELLGSDALLPWMDEYDLKVTYCYPEQTVDVQNQEDEFALIKGGKFSLDRVIIRETVENKDRADCCYSIGENEQLSVEALSGTVENNGKTYQLTLHYQDFEDTVNGGHRYTVSSLIVSE